MANNISKSILLSLVPRRYIYFVMEEMASVLVLEWYCQCNLKISLSTHKANYAFVAFQRSAIFVKISFLHQKKDIETSHFRLLDVKNEV